MTFLTAGIATELQVWTTYRSKNEEGELVVVGEININ